MTHDELIAVAAKNAHDNVRDAICLKTTEQALVIFDDTAPLAAIVTEGYRRALPDGEFIDFTTTSPEQILERINALHAGDAVILVQSTNFRLNEFRLRIELFKRDLKTIEHLHLTRLPEDQFEHYLNALAYDTNYYRPVGHALKALLDESQEIIVECAGGTRLVYAGGMEPAKLNIGDYTGMKNVGGTFPIGEVFTEAKDLTQVSGDAMVFGFAGDDHRVLIVKPFRVVVEKGILSAPDAPPEFEHIIDLIKVDEEVLVRELGLGLNRAMGKNVLVSDITAFERQKGMHVSLGEKHAIYVKPGLHRRKGRYHIDIFIDIEKITIDGKVIFEAGDFVV